MVLTMENRGGTRTGAGRKPASSPLRNRSIKVSDEEWDKIKTIANSCKMDTSKYIRMVLRDEWSKLDFDLS